MFIAKAKQFHSPILRFSWPEPPERTSLLCRLAQLTLRPSNTARADPI